MINNVEIHNLGKIRQFHSNDLDTINLFIGENGTGKTFLLKSLYAVQKTMETYRRGDEIRSAAEVLSEKLRWTFQADRLGDLVSRGADEALHFEMAWDNEKVAWQFTDSATVRVGSVSENVPVVESNSVFIPAKEVLTLFNVINKSRGVDKSFGFDDTYYDLVTALSIQPHRGKNYTIFADSREMLSKMISGKVDYDTKSGRWYYQNNKRQKFSIGTTSEGVKKIAILDRLLANGYLSKSSVLFIDEPESSLHPKAISELVDMLSNIAFGMGIQVFLASHSYFVIKKLYLTAIQKKKTIRCFSLGTDGNVQEYDLLNGMPDNSIIDESIRLYEEEVDSIL